MVTGLTQTTCTSILTYSIQLIDEDDTGRLLLGFRKQLPDPSRPPPHKQLHKLTG